MVEISNIALPSKPFPNFVALCKNDFPFLLKQPKCLKFVHHRDHDVKHRDRDENIS